MCPIVISRAVLRQTVAAVPRPLAALLIIVAIVGASWAMIMPPWQSPDAFTHYAYAESLATRHALPGRAGHPESSSSVQATSAGAAVARAQWSTPEATPTWNAAAVQRARSQSSVLSRSDGAGFDGFGRQSAALLRLCRSGVSRDRWR